MPLVRVPTQVDPGLTVAGAAATLSPSAPSSLTPSAAEANRKLPGLGTAGLQAKTARALQPGLGGHVGKGVSSLQSVGNTFVKEFRTTHSLMPFIWMYGCGCQLAAFLLLSMSGLSRCLGWGESACPFAVNGRLVTLFGLG